MKALQINTVAGEGATGRIVDAIAERLTRDDDEAIIAASRGDTAVAEAELWRIGSRAGCIAHFLASRLLDRHGLASRHATEALCRRIDAARPDVVHLHNLHGYYLHLPALLKYLIEKQIPVVVTLHDHWLLTGHCASPDIAGCKLWMEAQCRHCPLRGSYPRSYTDRSGRNVALKRELLKGLAPVSYVAVSQWMKSEAEKAGLYPVRLITNGIDSEFYSPAADEPRRPVVLAVANVWNTAKGADRLVELRRLLPPEVEIEVAGEIRYAPLSHQPGITRLGYLNAEEMRAKLRSAAVAVSLSRSETWGMAVAEALACGTPVVGFANTATTEMLAACGGTAVADVDIKALATEVMAQLRRPFDSDAARRRHQAVATRYSSAAMAQTYLDLYHQIADNVVLKHH